MDVGRKVVDHAVARDRDDETVNCGEVAGDVGVVRDSPDNGLGARPDVGVLLRVGRDADVFPNRVDVEQRDLADL